MGLGPDPSGEPEVVEQVGVEIDRLGRRIAHTGRGERWERLVRARLVEIGIGDVPLALVVRVVATGSEPVADRGDRGGIEPEQITLQRRLGDARGLGDAVQRRVLPGEERGAARCAGAGHDVVVAELHAPRTQERLGRQIGSAPRSKRRRLVGRGHPLLVDDDQKEVRLCRQRTARYEGLRAAPRLGRRRRRRGRRSHTCGSGCCRHARGTHALEHLAP